MARHDRFVAPVKTATQVLPAAREDSPLLTGKSLSVAIASVLAAGTTGLVFAGNSTITVSPDHPTATTVANTGNTYDVNTTTVRNRTGFNSFSAFNVAQGDTVNLRLAPNTDNLVNLVWDSQASINGILNSYKDGSIGAGRVFFADPFGFVVGATGVVNVGALSIATPSRSDMVNVFDDTGDAFEQLMYGKLSSADGGEVRIEGEINALDDVRIQAHSLDVSGLIWVQGGTGAAKLDSRIAVNTGAGTGTRLVQDGDTILLVGEDSVSVAGTLRNDGGNVILQSDDTVSVSGTINTRDVAARQANPGGGVSSSGDSGHITAAGATVNVTAAGVLNAAATGAHAAGDITLEARARDKVQTGQAKAVSSVNIDGTLDGRDINATAQSTAESGWDLDSNGDAIDPLLVAGSQVLGLAAGISLGYLDAVSTATVSVGSGAHLTAAGDLTLDAKAIERVDTSASNAGSGAVANKKAGIAAVYGAIDADATVTVASGAVLIAADALNLRARTENTLEITAASVTTGDQALVATIAVSDINVDSTVAIAAGATLQGRAVEISAHNQNSFSTSASAQSNPNGKVGIAGAVSLQDVNATATNAASLVNIGSLLLDASTATTSNLTRATVSVASQSSTMAMHQAVGDAKDAVTAKIVGALKSATGIAGSQSSDPKAQDSNATFRLGSALAFTDATHNATATLADNTSVTATGNVTVHAGVIDGGIRNQANSTVDSDTEQKEQDGSMSKVTLSAGMTYGHYRHNASATVGKGASIDAARIAIGSETRIPTGMPDMDFSSIGDALGTISSVDDVLTSYTSAKSKAGTAAIGGAVNYHDVGNSSTAWVDDDATLTSHATKASAADPDAWTSLLASGVSANWTQAIDVAAFNEINAVHVVGYRGEAGQDGAAVGGVFNNVIYRSDTTAGIGAGATVEAEEGVAVRADSRDTILAISPVSGGGTSVGVNGTVSIADIDDSTSASISNDADVTAKAVDVTALQDYFLWSVSGALTTGNTASVGLAVAINNLSSDTRAYIGDNAAEDASGRNSTDTTGAIATEELGIRAATTGEAGAIAVAGSYTSSPEPGAKPGFMDKLKTSANSKVDGLRGKAADKFAGLPLLDKVADKVRGSQGAGASTEKPPAPKFGISVSGSASVNMADLGTRASLDEATVTGRAGGNNSTTVQAVNAAELASASGAAAITRSKAGSSKFNSAMAGAVAYSLIDNDTEASVTSSTLDDVDDLAVRALSAGEQTAIAISVGMEASGGSTTSGSFTGSFSIAQSDNSTNATLQDTVIAGSDATDSGVEVIAYDRARIGAGGGSLYLNTSTGSNANIGAAFTYAEVNDDTRATVSGGTISGVKAVAVRAIDSALIGSGAAMAGGGSQANGLAGAGIWNEIGNTAKASVSGGAVIAIDGDIAVSARAGAPVGALDGLIDGGIQDGSGFDFAGTELYANSGEAGPVGTSIVSVAGLVQAGKNNIGLSFVGSNVHNSHEVEIAGATLNAGNGRIDLDASDNTRIISAAVGVGAAKDKFAGMGSATANVITNTSKVGVTGSTLGARAIDAQARDDSRIESLAGNVTVSKGAAAGAAVTYNSIANTVEASANGSDLTAGSVKFGARNMASVLAGAVAGAAGKDLAISGSFSWTESDSDVTAAVVGGEVVANDLDVDADNGATLQTLSGSVAVSKQAAIGAAINVVDVSDTTTARIDGTGLDIADAVRVQASGSGDVYSLAVAGSAADVAIAGSNANNMIDNTVQAVASNLHGAGAAAAAKAVSLTVKASNTMHASSLAGAVVGAKSVAVGGAIGYNAIAGRTDATLSDSVLAVTGSVDVDARAIATIDTIAVAAGGAQAVAVAGSATTNIITSQVTAGIANTSLDQSGNTTTVSARDASQIDSLAGAAAVAGNAGIGAAVAINRIGTTTEAYLDGGADNRRYHAADLSVSATGNNPNANNDANIRTIAIGVGGGGDVGGAASVAVNLIDSQVNARIGAGADVLAQNNVAVLAQNRQGIDVFAGSVGLGATVAGIGLGVVVNEIGGQTTAVIEGPGTRVSALAKGAGRSVTSGDLLDPDATDVSDVTALGSYVAPDLTLGTLSVNGVAVNAANQQHVSTAAAGIGLSAGAFALAAITGTNVLGGSTRASINGASINQAAGADSDQQVDVRASSHAMGANFITGAAASSGGAATAAVASNVFSQDTEASIHDATTSARNGVTVDATSSQNSLALSAGVAGAIAGGAASASINVFDARTRAFVTGGTLASNYLGVDASSVNHVNLISGSGAGGGVGVAGSFLVNVGQSTTQAYVGDASADTTLALTGALDVSAASASVIKGIAVSGAVGGAAGVAGMATVNVLANTTQAWLQRAQVSQGAERATTVDVSAKDSLELKLYAGALGVGGGGLGVGAAANVAVLGSTVSAAVVDSRVDASGAVTVDALSQRDIDAITITAGVGQTAGIGGAASLLLVGAGDRGDSNSELDKGGDGTMSRVAALAGGPRVDAAIGDGALSASDRDGINQRSSFNLAQALGGGVDGTFASVANSALTAGSLAVTADSQVGIRHIAGGFGAGGVGIGGALAYTGVYDTTRASIDDRSQVTVTGGIEVDAHSGDHNGRNTGHAEAYAGGAGLVGIGAAVAIANVDRKTTARAGGTLQGGANSTLAIHASDTSTVDAKAIGAAIGAAAVGVVVAVASKSNLVNAALTSSGTNAANVSGFNAFDIDARSSGTVTGKGVGAAGGLVLAGTGVGVTASDESVVSAEIGSNAAVQVGAGGTSLTAQATPQVSADALGATVSGSVGLGASVALAKADANVTAQVGANSVFSGGNLDINATVGTVDATTPSAHAKAIAGTGGILLGASAVVADASNGSDATAQTAANVRLPSGTVSVKATNNTSQKAESLGVSAGLLALGASVSKATSTTTTTARLGDGNIGHGVQVGGLYAAMGAVNVHAAGSDRNAAYATAGSGGLVAGNAALASTDSNATVTAAIGIGSDLTVSKLDLKAEHDTRYAGNADSVNAAALGASGAEIRHQADSTVRARIDNDASVRSNDDIRVQATNSFNSDNTGASVTAAGGGVITGAAALVDVDLNGSTFAEVGSGASLLTATAPSGTRAGEIHVIANTLATTADSGSLTTGGAINVAVVDIDVTGHFDNDVVIGDNAWLNSYGYINLGTYTQATLGATALVNTWGLAAVGSADADVDVSSDQNVTVGANALLEAYRNIYLTAGRDARNLQDTRLGANSQAQAYVRGLIAIPDASASGHTASTAGVVLAAGANALSASNVTVGGYAGESRLSVDGTGHGYQLGFIPVTQHDSDSGSTARGTVALDGTVVAGRYNTLRIDIDANGNLTQGSGLAVDARRVSDFSPRGFLDGLAGDCAGADVDGCKAMAALRNSVAAGPVGAWYLGSMFAAGGDVFLHADSITGSGSATAKGAPTITVNNLSNHYLVLDSIDIPDYSGGNVRYTGSASGAGGVAITQEPSGAKPSVQIHNAWQGSDGPAIFAMEDIRNIGGLVRIRNDQGSFGQFGTVYAQQQIVEAPNGIVTFNNLNADWFSGSNPQSDWRSLMLRPGTPDEAVAHIANYLYGSGAGLLYQGPIYSGDQGSSIVLWGGCLPHSNDAGCGVGPFGTTDFYQKQMPIVPVRALTKTILGYGENPQVAANAANSSFIGQQIYVRANYIDVNSTIDAGAGTNWSLVVDHGLQSWIAGLGAGASGLHDIPANYLNRSTGTRQISAKYDASNKRIVVDDVNASGGGYVYLDGRIVSSTPHGKIKVSSGYGDVRVVGAVGVPVTLQNINVGNGAVGVVEIVDRQKAPVGNTPYTTWYVSRQGQGTQAYDNRYGATNYDAANAFKLGDAASYNPQAGMRYRWSETARVGRADRYGNWSWVDQWGGGIDPGQQWSTNSAGFYQGTPGGPAFEQDITGSFSDFSNARVAYHDCDGGLGSDCNYSFKASEYGQDSDKDGNPVGPFHWHAIWTYRSPLRGQINLNGSVKADNAIAIDFSGNAQGIVDVTSFGDLFLTGRITNTDGTTTLRAIGLGGMSGPGDVVRSGDNAQILTRNLVINATGGIGRAGIANALAVTLSDNGSVTANAGSRGIWLDLASDAALNLRAQDGAGFGDVNVIANGDLSGIAGQARAIVGRNITLASRFGAIGSIANPLALEAHETAQSDGGTGHGVVSATALSDIALTDWAGDFWLDRVVSDAGDVRLEARSGALLDARLRTAADTLTPAQIEEIWNALQLDGSGVAGSVAAFENQVTARYQEYWRLLGVGTVSGGFYTVNESALALFRPLAEAAAGQQGLSDADVRSYVGGRYDDLASFFDANLGSGWQAGSSFAAFDATFAYRIDPASQQYAEISKNATWTRDQLKYSINANALEPSQGAVGSADPNVSGRNVTLVANAAVGRLAEDLDLAYVDLVGGNLDIAEALALTLANTPGDVLLIAADGHVLSRAELEAFTPTDIDNGAIASVRIKRTSPLFIQVSGKLNGAAGTSAFLQANNDLRVERFSTGDDLRLAAGGSIINARDDTAAAVITGGDLVLLAGSGSIGSPATGTDPAKALAVDIGGSLLSASAGQDLLLRQVDGDLMVGSAFAKGDIGLEATQGSIVSFLEGVTLSGRSIDLVARDAIGHRGGTSGSGISGGLQVHVAASGQLSGTAGTDAWIVSPDRDLAIGSLTAGGDLNVTAIQNNLRAGTLRAGGNLTAAAGGDAYLDTVAANGDATATAVGNLTVNTLEAADATLSSGGEILAGQLRAIGAMSVSSTGATVIDSNGLVQGDTVAIDAASLEMRAGSRIAAVNSVSIDTGGDMRLGAVSLDGNAAGADIVLYAGGRIDANGDGQVNVRGGSANGLVMLSGEGIGSAATPLAVDIGRLSGRSTTGDIHLQLPNGGRVDSLIADAGSIGLGAGAHLDLGLLRAANALRVTTTGGVDADTLLAGDELAIDATGTVNVRTADAGGAASVNSGTATVLGDLRVGGDATLVAGTTLTVGNAEIGGALDARSNGLMALDRTEVGTTAILASGADIVLGTLATGGDLTADAQGDLTAGAVEVGGNAALVSNRSITVDTARVAGALAARSLGSTSVTSLAVGDDATLTSDEDVALGDATIGGNLSIDAVRNLAISTLDVGHDADLASGGTLYLADGRVGNALTTRSGGNTTLDAVDVGTTATLASGAGIVLGTVATGGGLTASAHDGLTANELQVGGNADIDAGGALHVVDATVDGTLSARAGMALAIDTARIGGNGSLVSGDAMTLGTIDSGAGLDLQAGTTLHAAALTATEAMTLSSIQAMAVGIATAGGDLIAIAGTGFVGGQLTSGGNILVDARAGTLAVQDLRSAGDTTLLSAADTTLGTAAVAGALVVDSAASARIGQASVDGTTAINTHDGLTVGELDGQGDIGLRAGTDMALTDVRGGGHLVATAGLGIDAGPLAIAGDATLASTTMQLGNATVGGVLDARTSADMRIVQARVGAGTVLRAGGAMTLGDVGSGSDLDATAIDDLRFDILDGGRDVLLTSTEGDVVGGSARAGRDLVISAAGRVRFDSLQAGEGASLSAGADVDGDALHALNGDVDVRAGTDIALNDVEAGRAVSLDAGETLRLGRVHAGTDLALTAGGDIRFGALQAGGGLAVRSRRGDVVGEVLQADGDASVTAARDVAVGTSTVGGNLGVDAGRDLGLDRYAVDGTVSLRSGRDMRLGEGHSGGAQTLLIGGSLAFGRLSSDGALSIDAPNGRIDGDLLIAPVATITARDSIKLDMARIGQRLNMAAADIQASAVHTGTGTFTTRLTGYRDGIAQRIEFSADARDGWLLEKLAAMQAALDTTASNVTIQDGMIGETMSLRTPDANLWMDNLGATLAIADVQFLQAGKRFQLVQTGTHSLTDAYVVRFSPGYMVEVPNYVAPHTWTGLNYLGESALRYTMRTLATNGFGVLRDQDEQDEEDTATADPVEVPHGAAVNLGAGS